MTFFRENLLLSLFVGTYILGFSGYFVAIGNYEFIWYVVVMIGFAWLVAGTARISKLPPYLLWALALWGLMHMAGGSVMIGDYKLYAQILIPFYMDGEFSILKYDQLVHAYGFGVGALVIEYLLWRKISGSISRFWIGVVAVLAAMGLGVVNEIAEFLAVVALGSTGVGGYINNALDLVFNTIGAILAVLVAGTFYKQGGKK